LNPKSSTDHVVMRRASSGICRIC